MRIAAVVQDFLVRHPGYRHKPLLGYISAVVFVAVALGIRVLAGPLIIDAPFITYFPAVLAATFVGGRGPGLAAVVLGAVAATYVPISSFSGLEITNPAYDITIFLYLLVATFIALLVDWLVKIAQQNAILAKRAEGLLTELQHRVKNHIQIVASLLNLQARRADAGASAALNAAARRINTISAAYAHLYKANAQLDFSHHLHDIADAAASGGRMQRGIEVIADPVMWDMDHVMPLSLIVSEMIENALRHGLENGDGQIQVRLTRDGEKYHLTVTDSGGRLPANFDLTKNAGLGLQLITAMARRVQGNVTVARDPQTTFTLEFSA